MRMPTHTPSPLPWKLKTRKSLKSSETGKPTRACEIVDANGMTVIDEYIDFDGSVYADFKLIVESVNKTTK